MSKSIFAKYMSLFALIIVISFSLLATVISSMLTDYFTAYSEKQLRQTARQTQLILEDGFKGSSSADFGKYVSDNYDDIDGFISAFLGFGDNDTSAYIVDNSGVIIYSKNFTFEDDLGKNVGKEVMSAVDNGFYTPKADASEKQAIKNKMFGLSVENGGNTVGAVLISSTSDDLNSMIKSTVKTVILTFLWMLLATLIAVYFLTDRIASPIKTMSKAAQSFAKGQFDVRVPVSGNDEIAELALALNNMAQSLQNLESSRSDFLSNVSHDLRTPMTSISGFIDALLDGTIPADKQDYYLRLISDEVRRLSRLVAALLDVSRIQSGDRKFVMSSFDVCEMARVILISFEQKIEKKNLDVEFSCDLDNIYVNADHDAIYQILYNLCDNAVKFSKEGGKYRIKLEKNGQKVYVSVFNEGQGIAEDDLPRVFERFYKGDRSRSLDKSGTGLGLYIAKSIIDAHGEEIWVRSKFGEYCEFVFTLTVSSGSGSKSIGSQPQSNLKTEES